MKKIYVLLLVAIVAPSVHAQITITMQDIQTLFSTGETFSYGTWDLDTTYHFNVGMANASASQVFDFSGVRKDTIFKNLHTTYFLLQNSKGD
jgi:hypothetical protein